MKQGSASHVVSRHTGAVPPADLITPVRRPVIERVDRSDGSVLVRWPSDVARLEAGPIHAHSPMTVVAGNVTEWLDVWGNVLPETLLIAERREQGRWETVTYSQALRWVRSIGLQLLWRCRSAGGATPGTVVILTPNSLRQAMLTFAALYVGVPVAPVSPAYATASGDAARLRHVLGKLNPSLVYAEDPDLGRATLDRLGISRELLVSAADIDAWQADPGGPSGIDGAESLDRAHREATGERIAKIMFTSGSTGSPKGVVMTHAMLASAQATAAAALNCLPPTQQVYLEWLPWHHVMGGNINLHRALRLGASIYLDEGRPIPGKFAPTIANLREISPTFYFNVPLGYSMLVPALESDPGLASKFFERLEYMTFGGASLSSDLVERLHRLSQTYARRTVPIISGFGATETSGPALTSSWDMSIGNSVGLPAPGVTVKLVPLSDRYEMRLGGANIMSTYVDDPAATAAGFDEEGFYKIGDAVQWVDPADPMKGLRFAGRVAEDFKLSSGTWVTAGAFRTRVVSAFAPLVRDAVITGTNRESVGAMGFVDEAACRALAGADASVPIDAVIDHPSVMHWLQERLALFNDGVKGSSHVLGQIVLLSEQPVAEAFEITDKGYLNQNAILQRRAADVESLYATPPGRGVVRAAAAKG